MVQDLIEKQFGICYHPHYLSTLLRNLGFSFQKARFISDHLNMETFFPLFCGFSPLALSPF